MDASPLLPRWHDPYFGDLQWDATDLCWRGTLEFAGNVIALTIDPDWTAPTRAEQLAGIEPSRGLVDKIRAVELQHRRRAARELAQDLAQQADEKFAREVLSQVEEFADSLELEQISLHGSGELHYRSAKFFPGWTITVYFEEDGSFGDVEAYEGEP